MLAVGIVLKTLTQTGLFSTLVMLVTVLTAGLSHNDFGLLLQFVGLVTVIRMPSGFLYAGNQSKELVCVSD